MAYLTQFLIPVLLNPITKTISCAYADPVLTSHSYSISTRRANMSVLYVLMLMSPVTHVLMFMPMLMLMRQ